jgi:hypothetical protein
MKVTSYSTDTKPIYIIAGEVRKFLALDNASMHDDQETS